MEEAEKSRILDINGAHKRYEFALTKVVDNAILAGKLLQEQKDSMPGRSGFTTWIESNCEFPVRRAQYYMRCYRNLVAISEATAFNGQATLEQLYNLSTAPEEPEESGVPPSDRIEGSREANSEELERALGSTTEELKAETKKEIEEAEEKLKKVDKLGEEEPQQVARSHLLVVTSGLTQLLNANIKEGVAAMTPGERREMRDAVSLLIPFLQVLSNELTPVRKVK